MRLRNKKTGEIGYPYFQNWKEISCVIVDENAIQIAEYTSLAELNEEWEDAPEEPKEIYFISNNGQIHEEGGHDRYREARKEIGNYFDTREEAELAVEKLKAIQRLKSHYIKFKLDFVKNKIDFTYRIDGTLHSSVDEERIIFEDLALLFGGEK